MRLSTYNDWNYQSFKTTLHEIEKCQRENSWVQEVWSHVPSGNFSYLELGCSPGFCTSVVAQKKDWQISGVDFSNSEATFLKTLSLIGRTGKYYQGDIFDIELREKFDIVASYGLIEHFSGSEFEKILDIHDQFLKNSGYLVIEIPNFTGLQYIWHLLFDKPNLLIHNTKIMNAENLAAHYEKIGYEILYCKYVGVLKVWGVSSLERFPFFKLIVKSLGFLVNGTAKILENIGIKIQGKYFSPVILLIAKKYSDK